jgi:phage terminase small subunit
MRSTYQTLDTEEFSGDAAPRRLRPSNRLTGRSRDIFTETVNDCALGHFRKSDRALLERFADVSAIAEKAAAEMAAGGAVIEGKPSPWFIVHASAVKTMNALALRLRLSPQSRAPRAPKTLAAPSSFYDTMTLEGDDGDGSEAQPS